MPAPAWENLDDFLSLDEFAALATFIPDGGVARDPVAVIFDEPHSNAEAGEFDMDMSEPGVTCKEVDTVGIRKGDTCVISERQADGTVVAKGRYVLDHDPYPDGTGMALVKLSPE